MLFLTRSIPPQNAGMIGAGEIARMLAERADQLVRDLLSAGRREGQEWRCGSVSGEPGYSLGVRLVGNKQGIWGDFASGEGGDALDLVCAVLGLSKSEAIAWSKRWLGLGNGQVAEPRHLEGRPITPCDSDRWRRPWDAARPITGTIAEAYLRYRGLSFADPTGDVLRFTPRQARRDPHGELEHRPALLALLRDVHRGEPCGTINIYLMPNGRDRLRDRKAKTTWGRLAGAAVMLDDFAEVTLGLVVAEGVETAIALRTAGLRPLWAAGGAGNLGSLPVLSGIECLTAAADADEPGQQAAAKVIRRWRAAGRDVLTIAPPAGDWADQIHKRFAL